MKRAVFLAAILSLLFSFAYSLEIEEIKYLPPVFFVGDQVEIRITITGSEELDLHSPEELPETKWGTINSVRAIKKPLNWEVRILVTSFVPETQTLPPLNLGDTVLERIDVPVGSVLDRQEPVLAPPRQQLLLPSTKLYLALGIGLVFGLPLLFTFGFKWGKRKISELISRYRENQPNRRLAKILSSLDDTVRSNPRRFYIILLDELRLFMTSKSGIDCRAATTDEISDYVREFTGDAALSSSVMDIFNRGDLVKFANKRTTLKKRNEHLETVKELSVTTRSEEKKISNADT